MSIGDVQAFIQYSRQFAQPLQMLASMMNLLLSGLASAERIHEFLDAEEESPGSARGRSRRRRPVRGRVEFEHDLASPTIPSGR